MGQTDKEIIMVFDGHSIPYTYMRNPTGSYPGMLVAKIKKDYPKSKIKVVITAKPSENSSDGSKRFESDVLSKKPSIVFLDYAINDGPLGESNTVHWRLMVRACKANGIPVVVLTNSGVQTTNFNDVNDYMAQIAARVRKVAQEENVLLADVFELYGRKAKPLIEYVVSATDAHPNQKGHALIAECIYESLSKAL